MPFRRARITAFAVVPMRKSEAKPWLLLAGLALVLVQCGGNSPRGERKRVAQENEELRAELERLQRENRQLRGQPATAEDVYAYFANDPAQGTLAGLRPGNELPHARARFGQVNRTRSWTSEGQPVFQYEWDLEGGVTLRVNADGNGRLQRIAVVLADPHGVDIPTLAGLRLGQETFTGLQKKFGASLTTSLQLWGAQGLYTVAQRTPPPPERQTPARGRWRLEFAYQMPAGLTRAELDRIEEEVRRRRNLAVLQAHLADRAPFMIALEEIR